MPISFSRYIDITSGVAAGTTVAQRDMIARCFTTSTLVPPASVVTMESADEVGGYFGTASEEYKRATLYFGWISPQITSPKKISFARYVDADSAPRIYGVVGAQSVSIYSAIDDGALSVTLGATTEDFTGIDLTAVTSLSDVAAAIQTAVRTGTGTLWTAATVVWDATAKRFVLTGGATGDLAVSAAAGTTGTDLAALLGWLTGATYSEGAVQQTPLDCVSESAAADNNFGSFLFQPTLGIDDIEAIAAWNEVQNVKFIHLVRVTSATAGTWSPLLLPYSGTAMTLAPLAGEFPEMCPAIILAATDYTARNGVTSFMFRQFDNLTPSVTTDALATTYDDLRVNYVGQTQQAGQYYAFYQRGDLCGGSSDPIAMNVYANEMWLKDKAGADLMSLLLNQGRIPANAQGLGLVKANLTQGVIADALLNGSISVGKTLTVAQRLWITTQTGDDRAWQQVQSGGYWLGAVVQSYTGASSQTEYKIVYTLIYAKDDAVRKIEGTHALV